MNRHDPSERLWSALKRLAEMETRVVSPSEAIKRVKAAALREGTLELPERAVRFYADEYRAMVSKNLARTS